MNIKKGDSVIVIAGKDKGKTGKVEQAFPRENKVLIGGINMHKKHQRPTREGQKGQVISKPFPMNASNVMHADPKTGKPTRVGSKMVGEKKVRVAIKSGVEIK